MAHATPPGAVERLAQYVFDRVVTDRLADEVAGWLGGSSRFRKFVEATGTRSARSCAERPTWTRVATCGGSSRGAPAAGGSTDRSGVRGVRLDERGPDFTISFHGERSFNLEVTRPRGAPDAAGLGGPLLAKIRQLPPSVPNAVLLAVEGGEADATDVAAAARALRDRADARDEAYFATRGFKGTREFYERYLRLGGVLVWSAAAIGDAGAGDLGKPVGADRAAGSGRASMCPLPSSRLRHGQKRKRVGSFEISVQAMTFRGLIAIAPFDR